MHILILVEKNNAISIRILKSIISTHISIDVHSSIIIKLPISSWLLKNIHILITQSNHVFLRMSLVYSTKLGILQYQIM